MVQHDFGIWWCHAHTLYKSSNCKMLHVNNGLPADCVWCEPGAWWGRWWGHCSSVAWAGPPAGRKAEGLASSDAPLASFSTNQEEREALTSQQEWRREQLTDWTHSFICSRKPIESELPWSQQNNTWCNVVHTECLWFSFHYNVTDANKYVTGGAIMIVGLQETP